MLDGRDWLKALQLQAVEHRAICQFVADHVAMAFSTPLGRRPPSPSGPATSTVQEPRRPLKPDCSAALHLPPESPHRVDAAGRVGGLIVENEVSASDPQASESANSESRLIVRMIGSLRFQTENVSFEPGLQVWGTCLSIDLRRSERSTSEGPK